MSAADIPVTSFKTTHLPSFCYPLFKGWEPFGLLPHESQISLVLTGIKQTTNRTAEILTSGV
jgi:hypothetical protein